MKRSYAGAFSPESNSHAASNRGPHPVHDRAIANHVGSTAIDALSIEMLMHVACRADKFATLQAMATTCRKWNKALELVFRSLRHLATADETEFRNMLTEDWFSDPSTPSLALSWLERQLPAPTIPDSSVTVSVMTRNFLRLAARQPPELRTRSGLALQQMVNSVEARLAERQRTAYHMAVYTHPDARNVLAADVDAELWRGDLEWTDFGNLILENRNDPALCDGVLRALLMQEKGVWMAELDKLRDRIPFDTVLRWLNMELPPEFRHKLVDVSGSSSSLASNFTTYTDKGGATRIEALPDETVIHVAFRIDKLKSLQAMATACRTWNQNLDRVFQVLRCLGTADETEADYKNIVAHSWFCAERTPSLVQSWIEPRLLGQRSRERFETIGTLIRGFLNMSGLQPADQRAQSGETLRHIVHSVEAGLDSNHKTAYEMTIHTHPMAQAVLGAPADGVWFDKLPRGAFGVLIKQNLDDPAICDGVLRALLRQDENKMMSELNAILFGLPFETIHRWLKMDLPTAFRAELVLNTLKCRRIPEGSGALLINSLLACVRARPSLSPGLLDALADPTVNHDRVLANFVEMVSSDRDAREELIDIATQASTKKSVWRDIKNATVIANDFFNLLEQWNSGRAF